MSNEIPQQPPSQPQAPQPAASKPKWPIFVGLGLVAFCCVPFTCMSVVGARAKKNQESALQALGQPNTATEPVAAADYIDIDARALATQYRSNEVLGDEKYKGKHLRVNGVVAGITKDVFDNMIVQLATDNQFMSVHATMVPNQKQAVLALTKGEKLTVLCIGGGMIVGMPRLTDCRIQ